MLVTQVYSEKPVVIRTPATIQVSTHFPKRLSDYIGQSVDVPTNRELSEPFLIARFMSPSSTIMLRTAGLSVPDTGFIFQAPDHVWAVDPLQALQFGTREAAKYVLREAAIEIWTKVSNRFGRESREAYLSYQWIPDAPRELPLCGDADL